MSHLKNRGNRLTIKKKNVKYHYYIKKKKKEKKLGNLLI